MKRSVSRGLLGLALFATLLAAYLAPPQAGEAVVPSERVSARAASAVPPPASGRSAPAKTVEVLRVKPRDVDDDGDPASHVFAARQWTLPAAVGAAAAQSAPPLPASAPQAPPLPFRFLGRFTEDGQAGVFLQYNEQNLVVRVGDTIAEHYKVESLDGTTLTLRYAPLNQQQTLNVGGAN